MENWKQQLSLVRVLHACLHIHMYAVVCEGRGLTSSIFLYLFPLHFFQIKSLTEPGTHGSARLTGQQTTQTLPPISTSPTLGFQEQTTMPDVCTASTFQLSRLSSHPYLHSFLFDSFPGKCHYFGSPVHCYYCLFAQAFWFQNKSGPWCRFVWIFAHSSNIFLWSVEFSEWLSPRCPRCVHPR